MKALNEQEIKAQLEELDGWDYIDGSIYTTFEFKNFKEAFSVMTLIAFEAEALSHHPEWTNVYNELSIFLKTHDANGVTLKDFELAHTIENIVNSEA